MGDPFADGSHRDTFDPEHPLINDAQGTKILCYAEATLWRRVADGTLPPPICIGSMTRWKLGESALIPYRSAAFFARRAFYGEAPALAWKLEQKALHEGARRAFESTLRDVRSLYPDGDD